MRCNDRELALQIQEFHHDGDEQIHVSGNYGFANLKLQSGDKVSIETAVLSQSTKVTLRAVAGDLKALPKRLRTAEIVQKLYVEQYLKKDGTKVLTKAVTIEVKPVSKTKLNFEDEAVQKLQLKEDDEDLNALPTLRFKIEAEPESTTVSHFLVNAEQLLGPNDKDKRRRRRRMRMSRKMSKISKNKR